MSNQRLYYYTIGWCNDAYIDMLYMSICSLRHYSKLSDIFILADSRLLETIRSRLSTLERIYIHSTRNSDSPESSSNRKLDIFDFNIDNYSSVVFLDVDILIHTDIDKIADGIVDSNILYVPNEDYASNRDFVGLTDMKSHSEIYWSLNDYSSSDLHYLNENSVKVFNTGLFGFKPSVSIRTHFEVIKLRMAGQKHSFHYEQPFMNRHFNMNAGTTDRNLLNNCNYRMFPSINTDYSGMIIHFTGCPDKRGSMDEYMNKYMKSFRT
jgi:hypothetical protein